MQDVCICDRTSPIQNIKPLQTPNTPRSAPQSSSKNRNTGKNTKNIRKSPNFVNFFSRSFFCIFFGFGGGFGVYCWGSEGVLYFVWGTYDRMFAYLQSSWHVRGHPEAWMRQDGLTEENGQEPIQSLHAFWRP